MCARVWLQVLADAVSRLVVDKFSELTDNFTSPHARRKVLAGVVMTTGRIGEEMIEVFMFAKCSTNQFFSLLLSNEKRPVGLSVSL